MRILMIKILHVINNLGSGGAEKVIVDLVTTLKDRADCRVEVLLLTTKNNVRAKELVEAGIKIQVVKHNDTYDFRNITSITRKINEGEYDVVHTHLFPTQYWVAISKWFVKNKDTVFITTEHSTNNRRRGKWYFRGIDQYMYAQYDAIITVGSESKANIEEWLNLKNSSRIFSIENGVDLSEIAAAEPYARKSDLVASVEEDDILIGMVARFDAPKDQGSVIKAMSLLPENHHLLLVGEGELEAKNKKKAMKYNVASRVHFLGFREDVYRILKTLDIVVLSSGFEGLSISSLEALAAGKPFIASRVPGLEGLVKDSGLLFEFGDERELASIIEKLVEYPDYYQEISKKCFEKSKEYSIQRTSEKHQEVYEELLEAH